MTQLMSFVHSHAMAIAVAICIVVPAVVLYVVFANNEPDR